jgi:two-component system osmolarity sensor histidine kinase EnvZ
VGRAGVWRISFPRIRGFCPQGIYARAALILLLPEIIVQSVVSEGVL